MKVNANTVTKEVAKKIPVGLIIGAACAFVVVGMVYSAWCDDPDESAKQRERKARNGRLEEISQKRDTLFDAIIR